MPPYMISSGHNLTAGCLLNIDTTYRGCSSRFSPSLERPTFVPTLSLKQNPQQHQFVSLKSTPLCQTKATNKIGGCTSQEKPPQMATSSLFFKKTHTPSGFSFQNLEDVHSNQVPDVPLDFWLRLATRGDSSY